MLTHASICKKELYDLYILYMIVIKARQIKMIIVVDD